MTINVREIDAFVVTKYLRLNWFSRAIISTFWSSSMKSNYHLALKWKVDGDSIWHSLCCGLDSDTKLGPLLITGTGVIRQCRRHGSSSFPVNILLKHLRQSHGGLDVVPQLVGFLLFGLLFNSSWARTFSFQVSFLVLRDMNNTKIKVVALNKLLYKWIKV